MGVKQFLTMKCDYCKAVETLGMPPDAKDTRHWVSVKLNRVVDGVERGVELFFDSAKCAAQALKLIAEDKAVIAKDTPLPKPKDEEAPSKVREVVRFGANGEIEGAKAEAASAAESAG